VLRAIEASSRLRSRPPVSIRSINMRELEAEALRIVSIYNEAWTDNWGFVPVTEAEARHLAHQLEDAILPDLSLVAEVDGQAVACFVSIPDLNQVIRPLNGRLTPWGLVYAGVRRRRIDTVRVAMLGVKRAYRGQAIDLRLLMEIWKQRARQRLHWELAWVLEDNYPMIRVLQAIGAVAYKRYRLYQKTFA